MFDLLSWFLWILILWDSLVGVESVEPIFSQHSNCFGHQTHDASYSRVPQPNEKLVHAPFRRTIGTDAFYHLNPQSWAKWYSNPREDAGAPFKGFDIPGDYSDVFVFAIEVDGRVLQGWLHVVIGDLKETMILKMSGSVDQTEFGQPYDASYNFQQGAGEFVYGFPTCKGHDSYDQQQTQYQFMPCGAVHQGQYSVPWGFQYVRPASNIKNSPLAPAQHPIYVHAAFKIGSQICNNAQTFGIFATMQRVGARFDNSISHSHLILLKNDHVLGASDPVPRPGTYNEITCEKRIYNFRTGGGKGGDHDINYIHQNTPTEAQGRFVNEYQCSNTPTYSFFEDEVKSNLFGGRCLRKMVGETWRASRNTSNLCKENKEVIDPSTGKTATDYDDYIRELTKNVAILCGDCPTLPPRPNQPNTSITSLAPGQPSKSDIMAEDIRIEKRGVELSHPYALELWDTRIIHGICMTLLAIFVSPVNVFITRYFKETFKDTRILLLEVWYFVHHISIGLYFFLYGVGMWRLIDRKKLLGVSLSQSAVVHRGLGWMCISLTALLVLLGGFRAMNRCMRTFCIAAHWTLGMTVYFAGYAGIIMAVWIPGSPAATSDSSLLLSDFQSQYVVVLVLFWLVFDIIMHSIMTMHMCKMDKKLGLTRPRYYLPSPMTVLKEHETEDLPGATFRKLMLVVYMSVSLLISVVICGTIRYTAVAGRALGQMSCSHSGLGEPLLMGYGGDCDRSSTQL